jgi:multiple sugar transport system permease protein
VSVQTPAAPPPAPAGGGVPRPRKRLQLLNRRDKIVLSLMVGLPALLVAAVVWVPVIVTILVFFLIATPLGMFMAVLLDRELKGTWFYRSALYMPVVLSLALAGFIWQLMYSRDQGLFNRLLGLEGADRIDWYGDPDINTWAVLLIASWRHVGYIMLLYLAGLKSVDPALKEAAAVDGASEARTFFSVTFPTLAPINIVVLVITVIESLRAFDLVWVINRGRNGLEVIGALITANLLGEASLVGFGSALATILIGVSLVFIVIYMFTIMREERR